MINFTRKHNRKTIPLTPLIDIVFLLLIFFIMVTRFDVFAKLSMETQGAGTSQAPSRSVWTTLHDTGKLTTRTGNYTPIQGDKILITPKDSVDMQQLVTTLEYLKTQGVSFELIERKIK